MSSQIVKRLLYEYVDNICKEGFVNSEFYEFLNLSPRYNREHLVQKIDGYCTEVDILVSELECCSNLTSINFHVVAAKANVIEDKSTSIGAVLVRNACVCISRACEKKHTENLSRALNWLKNEFASTRKVLETCAQMERRLIRLEQKNR